MGVLVTEIPVLKAWQCIGCGRLESSEPCVGICRDRPVELVYAREYERVAAELDRLKAQSTELAAIVGHLAWTSAKAGHAEETLEALRTRARAALASRGSAPAVHPPEVVEERRRR